MVEGKEKEAALAAVAEVVGSNPIKFIIVNLVCYGIELRLF
jgi:hypothetical protein